MGSATGAAKVAAKKIGCSVEEWYERRAAGQRWCTRCKSWVRNDVPGCEGCRKGTRSESLRRVWRERLLDPDWVHPMKGKQYPPEVAARMGKTKGWKSPRKGIPRTLEDRKKISKGTRKNALRGKACPAYKDGKLSERRGERFSSRMKRWRFDVFARDEFTCQRCGDNRGGNLVGHHVRSFADFPELRFDVDNGLTLCIPCHEKEHYG